MAARSVSLIGRGRGCLRRDPPSSWCEKWDFDVAAVAIHWIKRLATGSSLYL